MQNVRIGPSFPWLTTSAEGGNSAGPVQGGGTHESQAHEKTGSSDATSFLEYLARQEAAIQTEPPTAEPSVPQSSSAGDTSDDEDELFFPGSGDRLDGPPPLAPAPGAPGLAAAPVPKLAESRAFEAEDTPLHAETHGEPAGAIPAAPLPTVVPVSAAPPIIDSGLPASSTKVQATGLEKPAALPPGAMSHPENTPQKSSQPPTPGMIEGPMAPAWLAGWPAPQPDLASAPQPLADPVTLPSHETPPSALPSHIPVTPVLAQPMESPAAQSAFRSNSGGISTEPAKAIPPQMEPPAAPANAPTMMLWPAQTPSSDPGQQSAIRRNEIEVQKTVASPGNQPLAVASAATPATNAVQTAMLPSASSTTDGRATSPEPAAKLPISPFLTTTPLTAAQTTGGAVAALPVTIRSIHTADTASRAEPGYDIQPASREGDAGPASTILPIRKEPPPKSPSPGLPPPADVATDPSQQEAAPSVSDARTEKPPRTAGASVSAPAQPDSAPPLGDGPFPAASTGVESEHTGGPGTLHSVSARTAMPNHPPLPVHSELPPHVPAQLSQAVVTSSGPVTELHLSPEELGSVRIELTTERDKVTVTLLAERPETLDLLRRHADRLVAEFRSAGFAETTIGFGNLGAGDQGGAQEGAKPAPWQSAVHAPLPEFPPDHRAGTRSNPQASLYLRL